MPRGVHRRRYGRIECPACMRKFTRRRPNQIHCSPQCGRAAVWVVPIVRAMYSAVRRIGARMAQESKEKQRAKRAAQAVPNTTAPTFQHTEALTGARSGEGQATREELHS